jgi:hypothetical protein
MCDSFKRNSSVFIVSDRLTHLLYISSSLNLDQETRLNSRCDLNFLLQFVVLQLCRHSVFQQELAQEDFHGNVGKLVTGTHSHSFGEGEVCVWMEFLSVFWRKALRIEVCCVFAPQLCVGVDFKGEEDEFGADGNSFVG